MNDDTVTTVEPGTLARLVESEINQQVATAKRYPRSLQRFADEAMQMVTLDKATAQECMYALPRDGKSIVGPSARFAEIVASAWGNNRAGARVVDVGGEFVTAQGVFHDLERNVAVTIEVQRRITDKHGRRYKEDMIGVTGNAAVSIALRNAILKGVPKAFWAPMFEAVLTVIRGDAKTLADRRGQALDYAMKSHAVSAERVCNALGVEGVNDIGLDELVTLRGMLQAIKDGDSTADQLFPETAARNSSSKTLNDRIQREAEREASTTGPGATDPDTKPDAKEQTERASGAPDAKDETGDEAGDKQETGKAPRTRKKPPAQGVTGASVGDTSRVGNASVEEQKPTPEAAAAARAERGEAESKPVADPAKDEMNLDLE